MRRCLAFPAGWFGASILIACALIACGGQVATSTAIDCSDGIDAEAWKSSPEGSAKRRDIARRIDACGSLDGRSRKDVRTLLGIAKPLEEQSPGEARYRWYYYVGEVNAEYGPADEQNLVVVFSRSGKVRRAFISP